MRLKERKSYLKQIKQYLVQFPIVALIGSRQCGKTTISKLIKYSNFYDLENPRDIARLKNPQLELEDKEGIIVIDEIQRKPELFEILRFLVDSNPNQKYLILGSASPDLIKGASESLAGRVGFIELAPFSISELPKLKNELWIRGGYPDSLLANSEEESFRWRENYIQTFLERDIPNLGINIPANTLFRFWSMIAHYHGQTLNYSELSKSFGISDMTVRKYLDILSNTFLIELLQPWYVNIKKRQVKSPKLYIRDSGIFHNLIRVENKKELNINPKLGASFEGFVVEQLRRIAPFPSKNFFFWSVHTGSEVDLFWRYKGSNYAVEIKFKDAPKLEKSLKNCMIDLNISKAWVVYPGNIEYKLTENITVLPVSEINKCFYV